jgi:hypothetical protein
LDLTHDITYLLLAAALVVVTALATFGLARLAPRAGSR